MIRSPWWAELAKQCLEFRLCFEKGHIDLASLPPTERVEHE